ncbi:MAG: UDP-N-acetylglucosamine 2-epimerase [Lentisphaeraceae bacterium]|nr:UDP-N-acetylglucosamine 2-epimerase [Lentisphaeraceae bacterium]
MNKITIFTSTRADYGILCPLISKLELQEWCEVSLIISGTHLMQKFGGTKKDIRMAPDKCFEIDLNQKGDGAQDVSNSLASSIAKCSSYFASNKTDLLIILGDRFEALGCALSAILNNVPIAHLHGGELTEGALDDSFRHCITKMSSLHFPSTETYKNRIIQMGENPSTVFNFGALAVENIHYLEFMDRLELTENLKFDLKKNYFLITYHPETAGLCNVDNSIREFLAALEKFSEYNFVITYPNLDSNHNKIIDELLKFKNRMKDRVLLTESLGMLRYLSVMKYCSCVVGNSSSGIIEAPILEVPTVNVGDRQKGRLQTMSIVNSEDDKSSIVKAVKKALDLGTNCFEHPYGKGDTSDKMVEILKRELPALKTSKSFYNIKIK